MQVESRLIKEYPHGVPVSKVWLRTLEFFSVDLVGTC